MKRSACITSEGTALLAKGRKPRSRRWLHYLLTPVLAPLLGNRMLTFVLIGAAVCQVWLTAMGLPAWRCPIKAALGIPCPGCGLSTAVFFLVRGEWAAAIGAHLFAPVFLAGFVLMAVVGVMPERLHKSAVRRIEDLERRTGFVGVLLAGMILTWLLKMIGPLQAVSRLIDFP